MNKSLPRRAREKRGFLIGDFLGLSLLLILPALACYQHSDWIAWWIILGGVVVTSLLAYVMVAADKQKAQEKQWRIPEAQLHFWELAGGWPGSFIAQRQFRHKTAKFRYQVIFWLIVILYQALAFDCLQDWEYSRGMIALVGELRGR